MFTASKTGRLSGEKCKYFGRHNLPIRKTQILDTSPWQPVGIGEPQESLILWCGRTGSGLAQPAPGPRPTLPPQVFYIQECPRPVGSGICKTIGSPGHQFCENNYLVAKMAPWFFVTKMIRNSHFFACSVSLTNNLTKFLAKHCIILDHFVTIVITKEKMWSLQPNKTHHI